MFEYGLQVNQVVGSERLFSRLKSILQFSQCSEMTPQPGSFALSGQIFV